MTKQFPRNHSKVNKEQSLPKWVINITVVLVLSSFLACSGSSDDDDLPPPPPVSEDYPQKVVILDQTPTHLIFSVEVAEGRFELYSHNLTTGQNSAISDFYSANNGLRPFGLNSDGSRIAYRADKDLDGTDELYTNLVDGTAEFQVTDTIGTSTTDNSGTTLHYNWQWLFASSSLIFRSDPDADGIFEIQTVAFDGGSLITVSADLSVKCLAQNCWKTANQGSVITFMVESINQNSEVEQNLYRVLSDSSGLTQLNQSTASDTRLIDWQWSGDGSQIAFIHQEAGSPANLALVDPNTFSVLTLSNSGLQTGVTEFAWAPDDSRIAFSEDAAVAGNLSLYTLLPDGTDRHELLDSSLVQTPNLFEWAWAPDATRVAFRADQNLTGVNELFTVAPDGQFHRKMNPPMSALDSIQTNWQWSPDSANIAFHGNIETNQIDDELYVSAADGSARIQANAALTNTASLVTTNSQWTNNGERIIYQVADPSGEASGLYSVLANGGDQARINESIQAGQSMLTNFQLSPNDIQVAYQLSDATNNITLQIANIDGGNRINIRTVGTVSLPRWSLDGSRLFYVYLSEASESQGLFSVLSDGTGSVQIY
ncbi:hypothetical protein FLL45_21715 [Aliikangiella marina]|uniref:Dipeptidylpeptidase IV N-terminal domain-containing protein n=1 Tax=Aliikangiella marina TaxID=1712262 RepID=A0A545T155_9GAMM|nr:PD40 domain-containing protein [Aliikangiella marina]TQV70947.1 hypothetical protein FLL45_21715 [Aliikangiella marina]